MNTETVREISDYIKNNTDTPFEWGSFDCCIFISNVIKIQTGLDLYEKYKGTYDSETSALKSLKKNGSIESQLDTHFECINPSLVSRGDVLMLESGVMAIKFSNSIWSTTSNGLSVVSGKIKLAWRVK